MSVLTAVDALALLLPVKHLLLSLRELLQHLPEHIALRRIFQIAIITEVVSAAVPALRPVLLVALFVAVPWCGSGSARSATLTTINPIYRRGTLAVPVNCINPPSGQQLKEKKICASMYVYSHIRGSPSSTKFFRGSSYRPPALLSACVYRFWRGVW